MRIFKQGLLCALMVISLVGCGGGGSNTPVSYPSSGYYATVFRAQGHQPVGLSLVHPSTPTVEYVVSPPSGAISTPEIIYSATFSTANSKIIESRVPDFLVYVQNGNLNEVPLLANGSKPVSSSLPLSACSIPYYLIHTAAPQTSQVVLSTMGGDQVCGTVDDTQIRVTLANPLSASTVQDLGYKYLGFINSGGTPPGVWLESDSNGVLYLDSGTPEVFSGGHSPIPTGVGGSRRSLLIQDSGRLAVVFYSAGAGQWQIQPISNTTGSGWISAGSDTSNYYVYLNSGSGSSAVWQLLSIPLQGNSATALASGSGTVQSVALGNNKLFVAVLGTGSNNTLEMANIDGNGSTTVDTTANTIRDRVFTLGGIADLMWRATYNSNGSVIGTSLSTIDETGAIKPLAADSYPMLRVTPADIAIDGSTKSTLFTFVDGLSGSTGASGAQLVTFDSTSASLTINGVFPGSDVYGTAFVGWWTGLTFGPAQGLFVDPQDQTGHLSAGSRVYTFNAAQANSFTLTTTQQ